MVSVPNTAGVTMPSVPQLSAVHTQGLCLRALQFARPRRRIACPSTVLDVQSTTSELVRACGIETAAVQGQGRNDRGLILTRDVERKCAVARIPLRNVLLVTDEPSEKLSIFGAAHAVLCACMRALTCARGAANGLPPRGAAVGALTHSLAEGSPAAPSASLLSACAREAMQNRCVPASRRCRYTTPR